MWLKVIDYRTVRNGHSWRTMVDFKKSSTHTMRKLQDTALIHLVGVQLWKLSKDLEMSYAVLLYLCVGRKQLLYYRFLQGHGELFVCSIFCVCDDANAAVFLLTKFSTKKWQNISDLLKQPKIFSSIVVSELHPRA